jgi:hypothetical protein
MSWFAMKGSLPARMVSTQRDHKASSEGYDLVRRGAAPCRVLPTGRTARVVTASLRRVLESGEPEFNGASSASPQCVLTNCTTTPPPEPASGASSYQVPVHQDPRRSKPTGVLTCHERSQACHQPRGCPHVKRL